MRSARHRIAETLLQYSVDPSQWDELAVQVSGLDPQAVASDTSLAAELARAELQSWQLRGQPAAVDAPYSWLVLNARGGIHLLHDAGGSETEKATWERWLQRPRPGGDLVWVDPTNAVATTQAVETSSKLGGAHTLLTLAGDAQTLHAVVTGVDYAPASLRPLVPAGGAVLTLPSGRLSAGCTTMLREGFGVTSAETALVGQLAAGQGVGAAAAALSVSENTARNQLKSVFAKTGVRRQADLLLLIAHTATLGNAPNQSTVTAPERRFFVLPDGRRLAYRVYGAGGEHKALVYHEGLGSSLMPPTTDQLASSLNVEVIATDRPGFGFSDPLPKYSYDHVLADTQALLDGLGVASVSVLGVLSGGAHAAIAAARLQQDVRHLVLGSARPPNHAHYGDNRPTMRLRQSLMRHPWLMVPFFSMLKNAWSPSLVNRLRNGSNVGASDRALFDAHPELSEYFYQYAAEATVVSVQGVVADLRCLAQPIAFDPTTIKCPVTVWHGTDDAMVQPEELLAFLGAKASTENIIEGAGTSLGFQILPELIAGLV